MKDHLHIHAVIKRVRSGSRSRSSSTGSRGSRSSCNITNHGEFKVVVLGGEKVGKTTICRTYVGLSKGDDDICLKNDGIPYDTSIFIDVDGEIQQYDLEIYDVENDLSPKEYRAQLERADGFILVYAKDSKQSRLKLLEIISDISHAKHDNPPMVVLCNKSELDGTYNNGSDVGSLNVDKIDVSAIKNEGLQTAFNYLIKKCVEKKTNSSSIK